MARKTVRHATKKLVGGKGRRGVGAITTPGRTRIAGGRPRTTRRK